MRNPNRRKRVMDLISLIWDKQNDTRFNQLTHNLQREYANKKGSYRTTLYRKEEFKYHTVYGEETVVDLFDVEDEEFIEFLQEKVNEVWKKN